MRPEGPWQCLLAQYVRAPHGAGQNPVALEVLESNAETHGREWKQNNGKTRFFLIN